MAAAPLEYVGLFVTVRCQYDIVAILGRQAAKRFPGLLRPPGGGVDVVKDLTLELAALREFTEETGIEISDLGKAKDIHKIYSTGDHGGVFTLFGVHCLGNFTNRDLTTLISTRHADARCPDELTEIVTVPVYDLLTSTQVRYDLAPDFRAEISVEPTASQFAKYLERF